MEQPLNENQDGSFGPVPVDCTETDKDESDHPFSQYDSTNNEEKPMDLMKQIEIEANVNSILERRDNSFGGYIYAKRKEKRKSLEELALQTQLSTTTLSRWERGELPGTISKEKLEILSNALDVSYNILLLRFTKAQKFSEGDDCSQANDVLDAFRQFLADNNIHRPEDKPEFYDMTETAFKVLVMSQIK